MNRPAGRSRLCSESRMLPILPPQAMVDELPHRSVRPAVELAASAAEVANSFHTLLHLAISGYSHVVLRRSKQLSFQLLNASFDIVQTLHNVHSWLENTVRAVEQGGNA